MDGLSGGLLNADDLDLGDDFGSTPQRLSLANTPGHLMREASLNLSIGLRPGSSVRSRRHTDQNLPGVSENSDEESND